MDPNPGRWPRCKRFAFGGGEYINLDDQQRPVPARLVQPQQNPQPLRRSQRARRRPRTDGNSERQLMEDIAYGLEQSAIPVLGPAGVELPQEFSYVVAMKYEPHTIFPPYEDFACDCESDCGEQCNCLMLNGPVHPYKKPNSDDVRLFFYRPMIFECNKCKCNDSCIMRFSQRGELPLEVFYTGEAKGFGLRSPEQIPRGARIGEYLGYLGRVEHSDMDSQYIFNISCLNQLRSQVLGRDVIRTPGEEMVLEGEGRDTLYNVDACQYGNVTRFINHSCDPNTFAQSIVYPSSQMPSSAKVARIVIFAFRDIEAWEELTLDYNPRGRTLRDCLCESDNCPKKIWF